MHSSSNTSRLGSRGRGQDPRIAPTRFAGTSCYRGGEISARVVSASVLLLASLLSIPETIRAESPTQAPAAKKEIRWRDIPANVAAKLDIETVPCTSKPLARNIDVIGTVAFDENRVAIAGPRLAGRITRLAARPGELVKAGDLIAEIESVELARAGARYLGLRAKERAASANAARERDLARKQVSSARDREVAEAEEASLGAQVVAAQQLLMALGLRRDELPDGASDRPLAVFSVRAPIDGVLVDRSVVLGQAVDAGTTLARIADLSKVWVNLNVFERDLAWVRPGLEAQLQVDAFPDLRPAARVRYIGAEVDSATRTARVQLDVDNPNEELRPGQFVTARLHSDGSGRSDLTVPRDALQMIESRDIVFLKLPDGGFAVREVQVGTRGTEDVEIIEGLAAGQSVATKNAFLLKSEVLR